MSCCSGDKGNGKKNTGDLFWLIALLAGIAAMFIFFKRRREPANGDRIVPIHPEVVSSLRNDVATHMHPQPEVNHEIPLAVNVISKVDDLTRIDGIGPKIAAFLSEQKISTFAQLAETPVESLSEMLHNAGFRLARPASWPEQARLAASEKWDELTEFIKKTKAG